MSQNEVLSVPCGLSPLHWPTLDCFGCVSTVRECNEQISYITLDTRTDRGGWGLNEAGPKKEGGLSSWWICIMFTVHSTWQFWKVETWNGCIAARSDWHQPCVSQMYCWYILLDALRCASRQWRLTFAKSWKAWIFMWLKVSREHISKLGEKDLTSHIHRLFFAKQMSKGTDD